jgi:hypothetical protein
MAAGASIIDYPGSEAAEYNEAERYRQPCSLADGSHMI